MFPQAKQLRQILVFVSVCSLPSITDAQPIQIVAPSGLEDVDGNETGDAPTQPSRVQWVYDSAFFDSLSGSRDITAIAWRPDGSTGAFTSTDDRVTVRLSTTEVNRLSTTYSQNVGDDETLVYDGPVTFEANSDEQPRPFTVIMNFDNPFRYDREQGNLLVDVTFSGFNNPWIVDNQSFSDGETRLVVGDVDSTEASQIWPVLAPTQFTFAPVPEPAGLGMVGFASFAFCFARRLRKAR